MYFFIKKYYLIILSTKLRLLITIESNNSNKVITRNTIYRDFFACEDLEFAYNKY